MAGWKLHATEQRSDPGGPTRGSEIFGERRHRRYGKAVAAAVSDSPGPAYDASLKAVAIAVLILGKVHLPCA